MNIAIVGGGLTGLTAAYELTKNGHKVTVFERESYLGGLAYGFKEKNWKWFLEGAYHHLFTNDGAILTLVRELGIESKLLVKRPVTANYFGGEMHQFDSPLHLLRFPHLTLTDKIRTGAIAAFCKLYPFWKTLEGVTAKDFFIRWGGSRAWEVIWEPLMTGKFGELSDTIAASWLWARIHKRTPSLVYFEGGFQTFVNALANAVVKNGGNILLKTEIPPLPKTPPFHILGNTYDRILLTTPTPVAQKLLPGVSSEESQTIPHLHAQVLILETKKPVLDSVYWLSITDRSFPFLAVVAHTNFMDRKYYGGNHITYVGNYLPANHPYLSMNSTQLFATFLPYLQQINPSLISSSVIKKTVFTGLYAQPVHQLQYSGKAPKLKSPIPGVYLANMDSIYPWDRGTNYAVELGRKVSAEILASGPAR